ncbi:flavohemoglobin expression-modulating QEGLA motif protein [soil metagenome]
MEKISEDFIKIIEKKLNQGKRIRRFLPANGLLHIDRPLPFLCVYRYPPGQEHNVSSRLVKTEASYLIVSGNFGEDLNNLIFCIAKILSEKFKAFLIFEIWNTYKEEIKDLTSTTPNFKIYGPEESLPATVKILKKAIKEMKFVHDVARVEVSSEDARHPKKLQPLLTEKELKSINCLLLGLEVSPFYMNEDTGMVYPLLFRTLRTELSKVIKKTIFDFVRIQTPHKYSNFYMLGRQAVLKAVWRVDQQLVEINNLFKFLLLVTPVNADEAWHRFKKKKFEIEPIFLYRLLPVDTEELKRKLFNIPIERVDDITLSYLFRDKRQEMDKMLTMLADRETPNFLYGSLQLFGGVKDSLLKLAEGLLAVFNEASKEEKEHISAEEFARIAEKEIEFLKDQLPELDAQVQIRSDIVGLMVSEGNLLIGENSNIAKDRIEALIQHEVGTHILTYFNGKAQPLKQLYSGVPGYEELQEGLAVLSEYLMGGLNQDRLRTLAARVVAIHAMIDGAGFIENFRLLKDKYNFSAYSSFTITSRVYRSGGFTKDAVYLRGLVSLLDYLKQGHELEPLLIGKIRQDYIPIMQELIYRKVLKPIPLKPRYLMDPAIEDKMQKLKKGVTVYNLIEN